jgi:hypothetical protein
MEDTMEKDYLAGPNGKSKIFWGMSMAMVGWFFGMLFGTKLLLGPIIGAIVWAMVGAFLGTTFGTELQLEIGKITGKNKVSSAIFGLNMAIVGAWVGLIVGEHGQGSLIIIGPMIGAIFGAILGVMIGVMTDKIIEQDNWMMFCALFGINVGSYTGGFGILIAAGFSGVQGLETFGNTPITWIILIPTFGAIIGVALGIIIGWVFETLYMAISGANNILPKT